MGAESTTYPENWHMVTVGDVAQVKGGKRLPKGEKFADTPTRHPYIRVTDFVSFSVDLSNLKFLKPETHSAIKRYTISKNDVYISIAGSIGATGVVPVELDGANLTENAAKLVVNSKSIAPRYLMYFLASDDAQSEIRGQTLKNAQPKLALSRIAALKLLLPPLPEQKKIAHILSTVQRAIEEQERIIQTTTELKKALMQKLFTEGLRGERQKETEIGLVPESWEVERFDSLAVLQRGFDITKKDQRPGDVPVVSSGGISSCHDEAKVKGPGVVIGRKGTLGTVHYIASDYWPHDTTLWVKDFKGNNPRFVAYLLETMRLKRFDTGAANPTLNRNIVHEEKIAIPPADQQVEIGAAMEAVESKISIHERRKRTFQDLFRNLLHELMTAKTRVNDVEFESAENGFVGNGLKPFPTRAQNPFPTKASEQKPFPTLTSNH